MHRKLPLISPGLTVYNLLGVLGGFIIGRAYIRGEGGYERNKKNFSK